MKAIVEKIILGFIGSLILVMLAVIGFFCKETFATLKTLEKDVVTIRLKLQQLEDTRVSRETIEKIIKEYHDNHPCINKRSK